MAGQPGNNGSEDAGLVGRDVPTSEPWPYELALNEHDVPVILRKCRTCDGQFSVVPVPPIERLDQWEHCQDEDCESYEPTRDASLYFALGMVEREDRKENQ